MDDAISKYQQIHAKQPKFLPAIMSLGTLAEAKNEFASAEKFYQKALDVNPDYAPAANNLAWRIIERQGNIDKALSLAQMAKEKLPDDPGIADTLGWAFFHKNAFTSAIAQFEEALETMPNNSTIHYHLGMACYKKGDRERAAEELRKAIDLNPDFPESKKAKEIIESLESVTE
jgi:tetratricopeptide (TPR) repeat protein